jgi:hypothetical protein
MALHATSFNVLLVSRLYSIDNEMIKEYGAVGGIRIDRGSHSTHRKPALVANTCKLWFILTENRLLH